MPTAWFLCPYKLEDERTRYCAMDDFTPEIKAVGGDWSETEIDGNRAIVRVRASTILLASIGLLHRELSETEAQTLWTLTRSKPGWDVTNQRIIFQSLQLQPCKTLDTVVKAVPEKPPSLELLALIALWSAVGFGQGWRLPWNLMMQGALSGYPPIWGAAFPTTDILDTFTRIDEDPLANATWSGPVLTVHAQCKLVTNQAAAPNPTTPQASSYWSATTFGPDTEVFFNVPVVQENDDGTKVVGGFIRLANPNVLDATDGYVHEYRLLDPTADTFRIFRIDNSVRTSLGAIQTVTEMASGDAVGLGMIDSDLQGYRKPSGGTWDTFGSSRSDTTYTVAGFLGLFMGGDTMRIDDFGGGTVVPIGAGLAPFELEQAIYVGLHGKY